jgi:hypothetical protein
MKVLTDCRTVENYNMKSIAKCRHKQDLPQVPHPVGQHTSLNSDSSMPVTPVSPHRAGAGAVPVVGVVVGAVGAVADARTQGA